MKHGTRLLGALLALPLVASVAATAFAAPASTSGAHSFMSDVARHLGVSEQKLKDAIAQARLDGVRGLLRSGKITKSQAAEMERQIMAGKMARPHMHRHGHLFGRAMLSEAASYLGMKPGDFVARLRQGETPAAVATAQGKTAAGLEAALVAGAQQRLNQAVQEGQLTEAQAKSLEPRLAEHIHHFVTSGWQKAPSDQPQTPPAARPA